MITISRVVCPVCGEDVTIVSDVNNDIYYECCNGHKTFPQDLKLIPLKEAKDADPLFRHPQ